MEQLLSFFEEVKDPRSNRNQKHPFNMLIGTSLLASLGGIDTFSGFADFTESHYEMLQNYFDFPNGTPSHDTYQRFWDAISPEAFYRSFQEFTEILADLISEVISIDGKVIRNSGKKKALHIVSAWCQSNQLVLAQEKVSEKSNEITAIPNLLNLLDLQGRIVTIDAMGAQREICKQIESQSGDYVISLKGNQGRLQEDIQGYFGDTTCLANCASHEERDKGHGRIERRVTYVSDNLDWLEKQHEWPGLKSIGMVVSTVERKGKQTQEKRFYLSSLSADARKLPAYPVVTYCMFKLEFAVEEYGDDRYN